MHDRGFVVPDDVAVASIDNVETARLCTPSITTVAPDKAGIASATVEMLTEQIEGTPNVLPGT